MKMKKYLLALLVFLCHQTYAQQKVNLSSPDRNIQVTVGLSVGGELTYSVTYKNRPIILPSDMESKH
jgi:hypothetical protein